MKFVDRCTLVGAGLATCILTALASPSLAGPSLQVPIGPRAIAMGGAFSSISDDAEALYWNPAGLPWIGHQEITATHANLFGSDIKDSSRLSSSRSRVRMRPRSTGIARAST